MEYFHAFGPQVERVRSNAACPRPSPGSSRRPSNHRRQAARLPGPGGGHGHAARQGPRRLRVPDAASLPRRPRHGRPRPPRAHRFLDAPGCVPFINPRQFDSHYWPTLRPIIEEFWKRGHQTLFYAEGKWAAHLDSFRELPARSIVFHADRDDVFAVKRTLGDRFAISGGVPNVLLSFGRPTRCGRSAGGSSTRSRRRALHNGRRRDHAERHQRGEPPRAHGDHPRVRVYPGAPAPTATPPCDVPGSLADRAALRDSTDGPSRASPQVCASRGRRRRRNFRPSAAARILSAACGSRWTCSATTTSGSCC